MNKFFNVCMAQKVMLIKNQTDFNKCKSELENVVNEVADSIVNKYNVSVKIIENNGQMYYEINPLRNHKIRINNRIIRINVDEYDDELFDYAYGFIQEFNSNYVFPVKYWRVGIDYTTDEVHIYAGLIDGEVEISKREE